MPERSSPDRIFMLVDRSLATMARWGRLQRSSLWAEHPAGKEGKITVITNKWISYDSLTLDWQLDDIVDRLASSSVWTVE